MKIGFYSTLHRFAQRRASDLTDPGDEGSPAVKARLQPIVSNWPWIYVDFVVTGTFFLQELRRLEDSFRLFCDRHQASFQDLRLITSDGGVVKVRVKIIYRDDLAR